MCQKVGGAPYRAFTGVRIAQIEWQGEPKTSADSTIGKRGFCPECGTSLTCWLRGRDRTSVTICSLDDPEAEPPLEQNGTDSKLAWVDAWRPASLAHAGLARSRTHPRPRKPSTIR